MGPVLFWSCRNLSLIVPLCGLDGWLLQTEFILCPADLFANTASNETYCDGWGNSSVWPGMEDQLP